MGKGLCKLEVPPVKAAVEAGMKPSEALAEEIKHEISRGGRYVEVRLCGCTAATGCRRKAKG